MTSSRPAQSSAHRGLFVWITVCALPACGLLSAGEFAGLYAEEAPQAVAGQAHGGSAEGSAGEPQVELTEGGASGASGANDVSVGGRGSTHDQGAVSSGSGGLSAGAAGESEPAVGPPLPPFERCAQDPGVVATQAPIGTAAASLPLSKFAGWRPVPGLGLPGDQVFTSKPAVASRSASSVFLFGRSESGGLWQNLGVALDEGVTWAWLGWSALRTPAFWIGGVSATVFGKQGLALAARGTTSATSTTVVQAYVRACIPTAAGSLVGPGGIWSDWTLIPGGNLQTDPTIAFGDPYLFVVAQGTDNQLYFSRYQAGDGFDSYHWTEWQAIVGGPWAAEAAVVARPGGILFVAALGRDDDRYYLTKSPDNGATWSPWARVESGDLRFASAPALATAPTLDGSLNILGEGMDNQMWISTSRDDGRSWTVFEAPLSSRLTAPPVAVSPTEAGVHSFARGTDYGFHMNPYRP